MLDMLPLGAVEKKPGPAPRAGRAGPPGRPARPPGRPPGPGRGENLNKYKKDWLSIQHFFCLRCPTNFGNNACFPKFNLEQYM